MRILHALSQQPDQTGSGIYIQEILHQAKSKGHVNGLVASLPEGESAPHGLQADETYFLRFETDQLPFAIPGMSDIMPYKSTVFHQMNTHSLHKYREAIRKNLQKAISSFQPDIIHSHHLWFLSAIIHEIAPTTPVVTSCHGSDLRQFVNCSHLQAPVAEGCSNLNHIFALSDDQKNSIHSLYKVPENNITVVGSGVNPQVFSPTKRSTKPQQVRLLYAGKLSRAKGVPQLLRAIEKLDLHLSIAGDGTGEEARECHDLIKGYGEKVHYLGKINQKTLANEMGKADIFILPSLFEGMPLVVLEALSCGCQVVTTSLPGAQEIALKTRSKALHLIPKPPIHQVDQLTQEASAQFTRSITASLAATIQKIHNRAITTSPIDYFHWNSVFARIENVYNQTMK